MLAVLIRGLRGLCCEELLATFWLPTGFFFHLLAELLASGIRIGSWLSTWLRREITCARFANHLAVWVIQGWLASSIVELVPGDGTSRPSLAVVAMLSHPVVEVSLHVLSVRVRLFVPKRFAALAEDTDPNFHGKQEASGSTTRSGL